MMFIRPIVGEWYRDGARELFEVVAIDAADETIEIQYFDGSVTEMDFESWNDRLRDEHLENADAPEDWSGAVDVESENRGLAAEDIPRLNWGELPERSLRR